MQDIEDKDDLKHPLQNLPLKKSLVKTQNLINIPKELLNQVEDIEQHIKNNIYEWDFDPKNIKVAKDFKKINFQFPLPETIFDEAEEANKPVIEFKEQTFEVEQLQVRDLTQQQIKEIGTTGTFLVPSQKFDIPYKWKITEWIILGHQNIQNVMYYHLAHANGNFKRIFARFYNGTQAKCDMYKGLKAAFYKPLRNLYSLVIGKRIIAKINLNTPLQKEKSMFFINMFGDRIQDRALQEFFLQKSKSQQNSLNSSAANPDLSQDSHSQAQINEQNFEKLTNYQILQKINQDVEKESKQHAQKYVEGFTAQMKEDLIIKKIKEHQDLPENVKKDLQNIMRAVKIVQVNKNSFETVMYFCPIDTEKMDEATGQKRRRRKFATKGPIFGKCWRKFYPDDRKWRQFKRANNTETQKKYKEAIEKREMIEENIKQTYPIMGKHPGFKKKILLQECEKQYDFEIQKKHQNILEQLKEENLVVQMEMYKNFMEFSSKKESIEEKLELENNEPFYTFDVIRVYANPSELICGTNYEKKPYYYLKSNEYHKVTTNKRFWRLKLIGLEYYIFLLNMIDFLSFQIWIFLRKIIYCQPYFTKKRVTDSLQGTIEETGEVKPFLYLFTQKWKSIMDNRNEFENSADDGFLKKRYGRVYNLISNYIFGFLLYGVLTLLILLPVLQSLVILVLLAVLILSPVLMICFIIISRLFQLLIYDYYNYRNVDFLCCLPLISVLIQSGIGMIQASISVLMVVYDILRILVHLLLSVVRFVILHIYNFFTFNIIIKCLGRVPVSESSIAFRISGPGVGKMNFFYSLSSDNIKLLVRSKMEEIVLKNYREYVQKKISEPRVNGQELLNNILRQPYKDVISSQFQDFKKHQVKENLLIQLLDQQINHRKACFPKVNSLQKVRFKENELKDYLTQAQEIVSLFVEKDISQEKLEEITRNILKQIFNNADIIKPLDINAWQFQLEENVQSGGNYAKTISKNLKAGSMKKRPQSSMVKMDDFNFNGANYAISLDQNDVNLKYANYNQIISQLNQSVSVSYNQPIDQATFFMDYPLYLKIKKEKEEKNQK